MCVCVLRCSVFSPPPPPPPPATRRASFTRRALPIPLYSAERGLSNYLIYHTSKSDPKVAAHAADVGSFADDEAGNLVKR